MRSRDLPGRIRRLSGEDASAVADLLSQLGYPAEERVARERIDAWSRDDRGAAFGAELSGRIIGCVAVYVVPFFERDGARGRIVALSVDAGHRRRGIGAVLVAHAREFARQRGAVEIEVTSRNERADAHRFYAGMGFEDVSRRSGRFLASCGGTDHAGASVGASGPDRTQCDRDLTP